MFHDDVAANLCTIRGRKPDGEVYQGQGYLLSPRHILTARHILSGFKTASIQIRDARGKIVTYADGDPEQRRIFIAENNEDLAVIQLAQPFAEIVKPQRPIGPAHHFWVATARDGFFEAIPAVPVRATEDNRWFQTARQITHGHSGSPIFDHNGELAGMVISGLDTLKHQFKSVPKPVIARFLGQLGLGT